MAKTKTAKKAPATKASKGAKAAPAQTAEATKPAKKTKAAGGEVKAKKMSAIDAAAKVLADAKEPMNAKQLIEAMGKKGLWSSPGGKTPHATLYTAVT